MVIGIGLLAVLSSYCLYVCVHLSKGFTVCLSLGCLLNVRSVVLLLALTHLLPNTYFVWTGEVFWLFLGYPTCSYPLGSSL